MTTPFHICSNYAVPAHNKPANNMRCVLCDATWIEREHICQSCAEESGIKPDYLFTER